MLSSSNKMLEKPAIGENQLSKEEYLILRAKEAMSTDIFAAKSWLITAKSLFPHSAKVQFEAYRIEKLSRNVKDAAKCFSEIFQNFPDDREIWKEIEMITSCLRLEQCDPDSEFLCQLFQHLPQDLQHRLLLMTADHSEDTMEHCKLLLLLLKRFPQTVATYGTRLVETLLTAEKHSHPGRTINDFRKLLACEALPLLGAAPIELGHRLSLRLLCKTIEFYLAYIQQPPDAQIQKPWERLFQVVELIGKKLNWELSALFSTPWSRDAYCERLQQFAMEHNTRLADELVVRQLLICSVVVLLRILDEHGALLNSGETQCFLVETIPKQAYPMPRKRSFNDEVLVTSDGEYSGNGLTLAVKLWDLMHTSGEYLQREMAKFSQQLKLENWYNTFLLDLAIHKGMHQEALNRLKMEKNTLVSVQLRLASIFFSLQNYEPMFEHILQIFINLPTMQGQLSSNLRSLAPRHVHYVQNARLPIMQYCCKILQEALKSQFMYPSNSGAYAIGHALVLSQIDWPQEKEFFFTLIHIIKSRGSFFYPWFNPYIICADIIEELSYLWSEHGGGITLDIVSGPNVNQSRRIATRGADKGAREDIKQTIRKQVAKDGIWSVEELIQQFVLKEKAVLLSNFKPVIDIQ